MQFPLFRGLQLLVPLWLLPVVLPATVIGLPNVALAQGNLSVSNIEIARSL